MEIDGLQCDVDDMVEVEIEIDDDTMELLERMAEDRGVSIDQLINDALESVLDAESLPIALDPIDEDLSSS